MANIDDPKYPVCCDCGKKGPEVKHRFLNGKKAKYCWKCFVREMNRSADYRD